MAECSVPGCDRPVRSRGWCNAHYMRWYNTGVEPVGAVKPIRRSPAPCAVKGCVRNAREGEHCGPHAKRRRRNGDTGPVQIQAKAGNGKGKARWKARTGYWWVRMPDHPNAYANGTLQEHTVVMAEKLGRPLLPGENVHHKNGRKDDNRPQNLELWSTHQPKGQRVLDQLAWAREVIDLYGHLPPEALG